ncbi:hypothetical protein RJ640_010134 [Escallonia rubra]|uniref:CCHC-type domain-containing protein n=1 Tax=Escallonia rubra TaxID=112253 RepID=A0AA88QJ29_9ASTE|nr:hypothetical protein RJ640_010134 [Escallonia rubra]
MAASGNSVNFSQSLIPIFKDENFEFWSIKMKTLFKSQDLWELVENGYADPDEENNNRLKENKKKDNKALLFIQQAVHETIFSRIAAATTSKEAWEILHKEFQGSSKVITVKLQSLRRDFETLFMRNNESVQDFLSRVTAIVSQMKSYGEQITDEIVVAKVLRSLTPTFDHVVAAIEESKDLTVYAFDELMGSLQAHEARLNRSLETKNEEKAFQVREESSNQRGRGHNRGGFRGRSRGRGRFFGSYHGVQCYKCGKFGHIAVNCDSNDKLAKVKQGKDGIFISQKKYATDLLKKFNMLNCKVAATPMNVNEKLKIEDGTQSTDGRFFRSLVGGLIYLTHTRPDIAFSVGVVSRFMHNPTAHHLGAAKRILRYIAGTRDFGLWYSQVSNFRLVGFSDSDWAGCLDDRRSTSGSIFNLGSGAITWTSKRQPTVALSSSEADLLTLHPTLPHKPKQLSDTFERGQLPELLPRLVPNNRLVVARDAAVLRRDVQPVVRPGHDLGLALHHALVLQTRTGLLVVLAHRELADLLHFRVFRVLDRLPAADPGLFPATHCGGDVVKGGCHQERDDK